MNFEIEDADGYKVVRCNGVLNGSAREPMDEVVHPIIEHASSRLLVDLSGVDRITSDGISVLVTLVARSNSKRSRVVFVQPSAFVKTIFETTKINRFLDTEDTLEQGIRRLTEASEPVGDSSPE